jgi:hypothetical protein
LARFLAINHSARSYISVQRKRPGAAETERKQRRDMSVAQPRKNANGMPIACKTAILGSVGVDGQSEGVKREGGARQGGAPGGADR